MFRYFRGNEGWSYHFAARIINVAQLGGADFHECHRVAERIKVGDGESWYREWVSAGERVEKNAREAQRGGRPITAREAYLRASNYFRTAQFFLPGHDSRKKDAYLRCVACFHAALPYFDNPPERVTFPFAGTHLSGYYYRPIGAARQRHGAVAYLGGVDIISEELYFFAAQQMLQRGLGVLCFDGPGMGEPLRVRNVYARPDYEVAIRAAVDYLLTRPDVDADKIALVGQSMGGYYGGRGAAREPRLRAAILWGACYDLTEDIYDFWPAVRPQIDWVIGATDEKDAREKLTAFTLKGVLRDAKCPVMVTHGQDDTLVSVAAAHKTYNELPQPKHLRIWTEAEGGAIHLMNDNRAEAIPYMLDWLVEELHRPRGSTRFP
ncbi:MAG: alpha/beta fold hydrolase [Xanthobacteraceae bacterium]